MQVTADKMKQKYGMNTEHYVIIRIIFSFTVNTMHSAHCRQSAFLFEKQWKKKWKMSEKALNRYGLVEQKSQCVTGSNQQQRKKYNENSDSADFERIEKRLWSIDELGFPFFSIRKENETIFPRKCGS